MRSSSSGPRCSGTSSRRCGPPTPSARWSSSAPRTSTCSAWPSDELEAAVQVFHVRSGKVVGRSALFVDKVEDLTPAELMERILVDVYADPASGVPRQVLVPTMPDDADAVTEYLDGTEAGPVAIRVPVRGPKRALLQTVEHNAGEAFVRHRLHRTSDHNSRARALESLQRELGLPEAPLRIECYDMSHLQGTDYVGSMVVFEDGLPKKSDYRHFRVATVPGNDDYAAMEEVLTRRLTALLRGRRPRIGLRRREGRHRRSRRRRRRPGVGPGPGPAPLRLSAPAAPPRRGPGPAQRGRPGARVAGADRPDPGGRPGQELRGGLPAGQLRAHPPAPAVRGPLPAPAPAGRGPPLRHLLPPHPAGQADDRRCAGRGQRPGTQAPDPAASSNSAGWPPSGTHPRTSSSAYRGYRPRWARRSSTGCTRR